MNASRTTVRERVPTDIFDAIHLKDEEALKNFVDNSRIPLKSLKNSEKQTAAHVAAQYGHLQQLKYLLQKDSSVLKLTDHYGNNVLFWATRTGNLEMVKYLVDSYGVDMFERNRLNLGNCAVHIAAEYGKLNILKYCLETENADVNIQNDAGEPPIFLAAEKSQAETIKYLLDGRNANITMTDDANESILFVCAKTGEVELPLYLMDDRKIEFDIDHRNIYGCTVTFVAARYGNLDLVKYFVGEKHANISIADENGNTPLHEAADVGHYEVVHYLVERGADLDARERIGNKTALQKAKDTDIKRFLKNSARKRTPRSLPESFSLSATSCSQTQENCVGIRESKTFNKIVFPQFHAMLVVANACANFFTKSRYKPQTDSSVMSPPEILEKRMDPLAEKAAINFLDSSNN